MLSLACIAWSCCSLITGHTNSLLVLGLMRALLGGLQGAFEPAAFSMVSDQFEDKEKPLANSVLTTAPFVGGGLTAFNIMLIATVGWRNTISAMGVLGLIFGVVSLLFMKEPERAKPEEGEEDCQVTEPVFEKFKNSFKNMWQNPVTRYCSLAGGFRTMITFSCDYFLPLFFVLSYPDYKT